MDIIEIRRANLRRWLATNGTPTKEKSLFSQLKGVGSFGEKVARRLEAQYRMGDGWLDRIPEGLDAVFDENVTSASVGARAIPVISAVQAGAMRDMDSPYEPGDGYAVEYTDDKLSKWAFALDIEGLSMMSEFRPGDRVIIDPELAPNPGDFVVAKNGGSQATFKKYRPRGVDASGNEIFELVPLNDDFPTLRSDETKLQVIGVMIEHRKRYRRAG
ncbi:LexA family protein [Massilia sp. PWRC2]|uniref:LexA family protein n=1 Tax=Massilia sp. PWRC2 TaxID=2804626 RepID=UPI003CFBB273